jgi:hypothetical protein
MVVQPGHDWDRDNGTGSLDCPTEGARAGCNSDGSLAQAGLPVRLRILADVTPPRLAARDLPPRTFAK